MVACNDGLEQIVPAIGAVHVAGTQRAALRVAELVEQEQRVVAGAAGRANMAAPPSSSGACERPR
jgi:hypothetical protein